MELALERESARSAREQQAAGPHSVPENQSMERGSEHCSMELNRGVNSMECELERLRTALCESRAECNRLGERVRALQGEFDSEEPTPSPIVPPPSLVITCVLYMYIYVQFSIEYMYHSTYMYSDDYM